MLKEEIPPSPPSKKKLIIAKTLAVNAMLDDCFRYYIGFK